MADPVIYFLSSVGEARLEARRYRRKLLRLQEQATRITSTISDMPKGGSADSGATLAALADMRAQYEAAMIKAERREDEVSAFIQRLPNPEDRAILELRYLDGREWVNGDKSVFAEINKAGYYCSRRTLYRNHGRALNEARRLYDKDGNYR